MDKRLTDNKLYYAAYKVNHIFGKIEEILAYITLWGMIAVTAVFILSRFVFHVPTAWADESGRYLLILLGWMGASFAASNNDHLVIDLIETVVNKKTDNPEKILAVLDRISQALSLVFLIVFGYYYFIFVQKMFQLNTPSSTLPVPMWVPMGLVMVGLVLMFVHLICHIILPKDLWKVDTSKKNTDNKEGEK